jgi:hypothetical protein
MKREREREKKMKKKEKEHEKEKEKKYLVLSENAQDRNGLQDRHVSVLS